MNPCCSRILQISEPESTLSLPNRHHDLGHEYLALESPVDFGGRCGFEEQRERFDQIGPRLFNRRALTGDIQLWAQCYESVILAFDDRSHVTGARHASSLRLPEKAPPAEHCPPHWHTNINTNVAVVAAALDAFRKLGAAAVVIREGPGRRRDTYALAEMARYRSEITKFDAQFVDLNRDDVSPVEGSPIAARFTCRTRLCARTWWSPSPK